MSTNAQIAELVAMGLRPEQMARNRDLYEILEVLRPYAELWAHLRQMTWEEAHVFDRKAHDLFLKLGGKLEKL